MRIISAPENILSEHNEVLKSIAQSLLDRETLDLKDVDAIINEVEPGLLPSLPVKIRTYKQQVSACPVEDTDRASAADGDGEDECRTPVSPAPDGAKAN